MQIDRPNMVYRNGLLAEQHRERVNTVPVRYKHTWTVRRGFYWLSVKSASMTAIVSSPTTRATELFTPAPTTSALA